MVFSFPLQHYHKTDPTDGNLKHLHFKIFLVKICNRVLWEEGLHNMRLGKGSQSWASHKAMSHIKNSCLEMVLLCHVESASGGGGIYGTCISIALLESTDRFTRIVTFAHIQR